MQRKAKFLTAALIAGALLSACGDNGDIEDPAVEEPAEDTEGLDDFDD